MRVAIRDFLNLLGAFFHKREGLSIKNIPFSLDNKMMDMEDHLNLLI